MERGAIVETLFVGMGDDAVLVIGSTGAAGGEVVRQLVARGVRVRAAARRPAEAREKLPAAAEAVEFDFDRPSTWAAALDGVRRAFLISPADDARADAASNPLLDVMKSRGVHRVVNLTAMGADDRPEMALRKIELHLEHSGMEFTHLRPNWFMQVFCGGPLRAGICARGVVAAPAGAARISFVDASDVAAVAAAALCDDGHAGKAYTLTGGEALDHEQVATAIAAATGRPTRYVALDDSAARAAIEQAGLGAERADRVLLLYRMVRAGFCARVSPDVEAVLHRPPTPFAAFARDHVTCWR